MVLIDIVILVVVALSFMMGGFRGLVKEALSLATWIAALLIAAFFYEQLAALFIDVIDSITLRQMAAFALLFVGSVFVGTLISNLISRLMSAVGLGGVDRVLGALFGIIRGLIIVGLVIFVLMAYPLEFTSSWFENSLLVPYIVMLIERVQSLL